MRTLKVCPVLLAMLTPLADAAAQEWVPIRNPDQRRELYGFSILPPAGDGWLMLAPKEGHYLGFGRYLGPRAAKQMHTAFADVLYRWLHDCADARLCLEQGIQTVRDVGVGSEGVKGIRTISLEVLEEDETRPTCVWYKALQEDTRVPGGRGRPFQAPAAGLLCTHPDEPTLFLNALYSERFKQGQQPVHSIEEEARKFLESFRFEPVASRVSGWVKLGPAAAGIAVGPDRLWVQHRQNISEVDIKTGNPVKTFSSGSDGIALSYGAQSLWVGHLEQKRLTRIDPDEGRILATIPLSGPAVAIAAREGAVWVRTAGKKPSVTRVDPATNSVTAKVRGIRDLGSLDVCHGSVWVTSVDGTLYRVDPEADTIASKSHICPELWSVTCAEDDIWGVCGGSGYVVSIDPETGRETSRVRILGSPMFADVDDFGSLWVTHRNHGTVSRVALDTHAVSKPIPIGSGAFAVKAAFGQIWVTDRPVGTLNRITPMEGQATRPQVSTPPPEEAAPPE